MTHQSLIPSKARTGIAAILFVAMATPLPAVADAFTFSTGSPDGRIGTLSAPGGGPGQSQAETADDFVLSQQTTTLNQATFTGLIPLGASLSPIYECRDRILPRFSHGF